MFGDFLMGARSRLLPPSVPFRFFGAALLFHVAAWALLAWGGDQLPGFVGGAGPVLSGLHMLTLGVLAMTAMGAGYQIQPVATRRPLRSVAACKLSFWLFVPGVALLGHGLGTLQPMALHGGATLTVAGLAIFGLLTADNLRKVKDMRLVVAHLWTAMFSLAGLAALGLLLVVDWKLGLLPDRRHVAVAHAVLGGYGFMGMLVMGFSCILLPMFALSPPPADGLGFRALRLVQAGLLLAVAGALAGQGPMLAAAALLGLAGVALHVKAMLQSLNKRMRKRYDLAFGLIFAGWCLLPLSLVAGLCAALGLWTEVSGPLFGFLLVFGFLLTFLTGVLQRIMPFLASMNSVRPDGKSILVSSLVPVVPVRLHAGLHGAALLLVSAGIIADWGLLVRIGALAGLAGALAYLSFGALLWKRFAHHIKHNTQR